MKFILSSMIICLFAVYVSYVITDGFKNSNILDNIKKDSVLNHKKITNRYNAITGTPADKQNIAPDNHSGKELLVESSNLNDDANNVNVLYRWKDKNNTIVISRDPPREKIKGSIFVISSDTVNGNEEFTESVSTVAEFGSTPLHVLYKWSDTGNRIIISQKPPPDDMEAEIIYYVLTKDINGDEFSENKHTAGKSMSIPQFTKNPLKVYTPSGLRELIDYSKRIGKIIEFKDKELNDLIKQL